MLALQASSCVRWGRSSVILGPFPSRALICSYCALGLSLPRPMSLSIVPPRPLSPSSREYAHYSPLELKEMKGRLSVYLSVSRSLALVQLCRILNFPT